MSVNHKIKKVWPKNNLEYTSVVSGFPIITKAKFLMELSQIWYVNYGCYDTPKDQYISICCKIQVS